MECQKQLCEEKHKNIEARLKDHDNSINAHEGRLDKLENNQIRSEVMILNLCEQIKSLVTLIKTVLLGSASFVIATGVGFIIWYIQNH